MNYNKRRRGIHTGGGDTTFLAGEGLIRSKITMLKIIIYLRTTRTLVYLLDACKKNNIRVPGKDGLVNYIVKKDVQN